MRIRLLLQIGIVALLVTGCRTYYQKALTFNIKYEQGQYAEARSYLAGQKELKKKNSKVLYDMNYATASFMMDDTQESIEHFAAADRYIEDFSKNYGYEALALVSNPKVKPYEPEYFERVMVHFYQALNYIKLSDYEGAMVECRRMNLELQRLSDAFRKHDGRRYSQDAFGHHLMGILYETRGDNNNAFIAYRNALDIYKSDYQPMYGHAVPESLKAAIIRTAYRTGLTSEGRRYENEFKQKYGGKADGKGRMVVFVMDGLSPIKTEKSVEFIRNSRIGVATYTCDEIDMSIPIFYNDLSVKERGALEDFKVFRMTLPKYTSRPAGCVDIAALKTLKINGTNYTTDLVEDIDQIAKQSLKDRQWSELGKSILRAATKQALSHAASEKNEYVGLLVNLAGAISEQADTRCWTSLPASVRLLDVELPSGSYSVSYEACGVRNDATLEIKPGQTSFLCFRGQ